MLTNEASLSYDFILTIKIVLPSEDKSVAVENYLLGVTILQIQFYLKLQIVLPSEDKSVAVENYLEIYQNNQVLKIAQSTKEIPI
ncbi:hypothetical protein QE152_g12379 [Popillia japonica]|uniref:Uncharacterized protein n=1 Tax=Popillia japonica TaxID=7064 RepID=A0AAW1LJI3_POPJA